MLELTQCVTINDIKSTMHYEGTFRGLFHSLFGQSYSGTYLASTGFCFISGNNARDNKYGLIGKFSEEFDAQRLKFEEVSSKFPDFQTSGDDFKEYKEGLISRMRSFHTGSRTTECGELAFLKGIIPTLAEYTLINPDGKNVTIQQEYVFGINETWLPQFVNYSWDDDQMICGSVLIKDRESIKKAYLELFGESFPEL